MSHPVIDVPIPVSVPEIFPLRLRREKGIGIEKPRVMTLSARHSLASLRIHLEGEWGFLFVLGNIRLVQCIQSRGFQKGNYRRLRRPCNFMRSLSLWKLAFSLYKIIAIGNDDQGLGKTDGRVMDLRTWDDKDHHVGIQVQNPHPLFSRKTAYETGSAGDA